jgi:hypothetical protein
MIESYGELARSSESILQAKEFFEIRIPKDMFSYKTKEVFIYALDSNTIGILSTASEFWYKSRYGMGKWNWKIVGIFYYWCSPIRLRVFIRI